MSAKGLTNGRDVHTEEPIDHEYGHVGKIVLAECVACCTNSRRRLLKRDYDEEDDFKQSLVEDGEQSDVWFPCTLWRRCEECGHDETHFVC